MVFSSILFIFRFLPISMGIYFLTPKKFRNFSLLILSLVFYSWGEPKYFVLMLASIFVDYFISLGIDKNNKSKRIRIILLCISITFNIVILFFFKYINFFIENINSIFNISLSYVKITLPLGISFYTFQTMSYTIDVFLKKVKPEKNIIDFGAFVCLFPQLIAGPIVKYTDINRELKSRKVNLDAIQEGIRLFILGLSSKVIIANNIGSLWTEVEVMGFSNISTILAWMGIIAFALQIYFDFSGYSLMAIGLGKILGFNFPINFNYPYESKSITEFWRRWHISLGTWFREYVYIPLGGNRHGVGRQILNLAIVWFLTGLWHGAYYNFILWGVYYGVLLVLEKFVLKKVLDKLPAAFGHIYTMLFVMIGWSLFSWQDMTDSANYMRAMFFRTGAGVVNQQTMYLLVSHAALLVIAVIGSLSVVKRFLICRAFPEDTARREIAAILFTIVLFIACVALLVNSSYNPFLYFRF